MTENALKPKKRLGRMRRSKRLGIIVPVEGEKLPVRVRVKLESLRTK